MLPPHVLMIWMFVFQLRQYPQFLSFWTDNDLLLEMKLGLLKDVAYQLSPREILNKMDAQVPC